MSLGAWGDEGNTVDEGSFNAGQEAMYEDLEPLIDKAEQVTKAQVYEGGNLVQEHWQGQFQTISMGKYLSQWGASILQRWELFCYAVS